MMKKLAEIKAIAQKANLKGVLNWVKQAEYMYKTYKDTEHEAEVVEMIETTISKLNA